MNTNSKKILIIAGGSGGHIFPGIAVAHHLMKLGYQVFWLGAYNSKIESEIVPKYGIDIKCICAAKWRGEKIFAKIYALLFIVIGIYQSLKIIKFWKPNVALGMGGYVSVPGGLASWIFGIPLIIHEQNRVFGLANRFLSFFSQSVLQGFDTMVSGATTVGNPVRQIVLSIPDPIRRWKMRSGPIRVLVIGGSKGAYIFNKIIPKVAANLSDKLVIWHQVGEENLKNVILDYHRFKQNHHKIVRFIDNIEEAYAWADILISRSGALTVSEVAEVGLPAIFVPFIHHDDNQQYWNAIPLVEVGAAKIIEQKKCTSCNISKLLGSLDRKKLLNMAQRAKSLSKPNATQLVVQTVVKYL